MKKKGILSIILGILIVAIGVIYGGNVLGFWDLSINLAGWWTLFIIVPCAMSIFSGGLNIVNSVCVAIGVLLLLDAQGVIKDNLGPALIVPIIIIAIGLGILFRRWGRSSKGYNGVFAGNRDENYFAVFGGSSPQFSGEIFRGANAYAIFGGVDLRLRDAIIKRDCAINVYSIFGGTDIYLPSNVRVVISSTPVFGGVDNYFVSSTAETAPTVYIRALSVFGATDIK